MFTNDKRSSLLWKSVIYGHEKFYNIGPWRERSSTYSIFKIFRTNYLSDIIVASLIDDIRWLHQKFQRPGDHKISLQKNLKVQFMSRILPHSGKLPNKTFYGRH
jgi:hypothetical protein